MSALGEGLAEVGAVVAGVAGGGELDPFELFQGEELGGVGLAEGDVGLGEEGVGAGGGEIAGELGGEENLIGGDRLEQARSVSGGRGCWSRW